jgi:hypothetical protein
MRPTPKTDVATNKPAARTKGLTQLDRERAGSMADEGGTAGAVVESQKPAAPAGDVARTTPPTDDARRKKPRGRV